MTRLVIGIADLTDDEVDRIFRRADEFRSGTMGSCSPRVLGLVFLEASLRTRVGYAAAAQRLGWSVLEVDERRASAESMPESWRDTLRVVAGYADVVVGRLGRDLTDGKLGRDAIRPFLNGGSRGPAAEHPSQALIDYYAMERLVGPVAQLHVVLCGDLRMRAARSLLGLLARRPPRRLSLVTTDPLGDAAGLPSSLSDATVTGSFAELVDVDVVDVMGIPHNAADEDTRSRLRVDTAVIAGLNRGAAVLSPMPVIDEIAATARDHPQVRMHEQSDLALFVRMAVLELLAGPVRI